jgi:hypothetical protein
MMFWPLGACQMDLRCRLFVFFSLIASVAIAQTCPTCPPGYYCPPEQEAQQSQEVSVLEWYQKLTYATGVAKTPALDAEAAKYKMRAVRITTGNSCGSGSLVGRDSTSIFILTNAHVATNRPGNVVTCEAALRDLSGTQKFKATVIEGAYSSRETTDWSLLKAEGQYMAGIEPLKLSIRMPDHNLNSFTWGCPRCEVPSGQVLKTVVSEGAVWKWLPNSIGGQSGSGVHQRGFQHGLLTWSYSAPGGGVGAGQYTANIYKQSRNQTSDSDPRPPGLMIPACQDPQTDLIEGYAHAKGETRLATVGNFQDDLMVENGFLIDGFVRQAGVGDYPIWGDPDAGTPPPVDPPVDPPSPTLPADARAKIESAKKLLDEVLKK